VQVSGIDGDGADVPLLREGAWVVERPLVPESR
jgi:hypothetical protein